MIYLLKCSSNTTLVNLHNSWSDRLGLVHYYTRKKVILSILFVAMGGYDGLWRGKRKVDLNCQTPKLDVFLRNHFHDGYRTLKNKRFLYIMIFAHHKKTRERHDIIII